jgi:hypothetical protein
MVLGVGEDVNNTTNLEHCLADEHIPAKEPKNLQLFLIIYTKGMKSYPTNGIFDCL